MNRRLPFMTRPTVSAASDRRQTAAKREDGDLTKHVRRAQNWILGCTGEQRRVCRGGGLGGNARLMSKQGVADAREAFARNVTAHARVHDARLREAFAAVPR